MEQNMMAHAMNLRPVRVEDAPAVAALVTQLGYAASPSEIADRLARVLVRSDQQFLVAEADGRLLGWVHVTLADYVESGASAEIAGLVVDRAHRRQGIGAALMAAAEDWARDQRRTVMRLRSTITRTPAHRFYAGLGYSVVKTQYSFAKPLDAAGQEMVARLVPQVEPETR